MSRLIRRIVILLAAIAATMAAPAAAKNVVADIDQITEVMRGAGYKVTIKASEKDPNDRYLSVDADGLRYMIFPYGCDDAHKNCKSIQFFAAFDPPTSPTLEAMNGYARDNRWGRIYLDKDGDPAIEFDLDLEQGGMSAELFLDNVAYWDTIMGGFSDWVFGKGDKAKK